MDLACIDKSQHKCQPPERNQPGSCFTTRKAKSKKQRTDQVECRILAETKKNEGEGKLVHRSQSILEWPTQTHKKDQFPGNRLP